MLCLRLAPLATQSGRCLQPTRVRLSSFCGEAVIRPGGAFLTGSSPREVARQARARNSNLRERPVGAVPVRALAVGWVAAAAALGGLFLGLLVAKAAQNYFAKPEFDLKKSSLENAQLRAKVEELQQMIVKYEPLAYKDMKLRFTKGINKAVILGLVDELLSNKEVNIWWLPDSLERILYFNVISLMLSVLDEVVEGMSINLAGHNVKLQLTFLDVEAQNLGATDTNKGKPTLAVLPAAS